MRLGDLDALKEDFKKRLSYAHKWLEKAKDEETKIRADAVITYICEVIMTIDNAPTVDAIVNTIEVRPKGEWINTRPPEMSDNIVCSLCGYDSIASFNYCPNCGARMKGGAE